MSWGISKAGKGADAGTLVENVDLKSLLSSSYADQFTKELVTKIVAAMKEFSDHYPDRQVTLETSGHVEGGYGNAEMKLRVWPS